MHCTLLTFCRSLSLSCVVLKLPVSCDVEGAYCIDISGTTTPFHSLSRIIHGNVNVEALRPEEANDFQAPGGFFGLSIRSEVQ